MSEKEKEDCIHGCHEHYKDYHNKEEVFHQSENKELEEKVSNAFEACVQPKNEENGAEEMHKDETQTIFIPSWFLNT